MPIVKYIKNKPYYEVVVWEINETNDELLNNLQLDNKQLQKYEGLSEKRKREFLGIRACLKELGLTIDVKYDKKGKPFIENNVHISLSHSYGRVAVGVSSLPIGVDIELSRTDKINNIVSKFIRKDEKVFIVEEEKSDYLHIIWGIKEGLYKLNGGNLWNFLHNYKIDKFVPIENKRIDCWVLENNSSNKYGAYFTKIENYYLVWVIDY